MFDELWNKKDDDIKVLPNELGSVVGSSRIAPDTTTPWLSVLTYDAVKAYDELTACEALIAQLAVPNKLPVMLLAFNEPVTVTPLPLTNRLPVITALPENGNPAPPPPNADDAV